MSNTFFTSDTHFGHTNIAGPKVSTWPSGYRIFDSVPEMDEALITNWNAKVKQHDTVYHLGDFAFCEASRAIKIRQRLNGVIHLILGNHDKPALAMQRGADANAKPFASVSDVREVRVGKQSIWLSHYAHRVWNRSHRGVWHLYGHSHGSLPDDPLSNSFDVGVDCHNYAPLSIDEVAAIMAKKTYASVDHH
jgi:calcineurin-like phosphoesterase family protein